MNYEKIYNNLILDAQLDPKCDDYKENHHIIPKCMGGQDELANMVKLTARQHYLAHWLLYKIYKTSELVHAWNLMSRVSVGQEERSVNSHLFKYCKEKRSKILSESSKGEKNWFYNKKHSEESKKKMSLANKGKIYKSKIQIDEWVENVAKRPKSAEHKAKIGRKGLTMLQNKNTLEIVRVSSSDWRASSEDWVNPKKITPDKKFKCKYCNMITSMGNLNRWHNENCKHKDKQ